MTVKVDDVDVQCLVDTGSQVTLFSESLCDKLFKGKEQRGVLSWLKLRAANGLSIPYTGYIVADFQVGGVQVPARGVVVVRDAFIGDKKAILGMNVISDCWEELFNRQHPNSHQTNRTSLEKSWNEIFVDCQRVQAASTRENWQSTARLAYRSHITIPAQSEVLLWAKVPFHPYRQQCALVEPLEGADGVEVARTLVTLKKGRFPIRVRNINPFPTVLCGHM